MQCFFLISTRCVHFLFNVHSIVRCLRFLGDMILFALVLIKDDCVTIEKRL